MLWPRLTILLCVITLVACQQDAQKSERAEPLRASPEASRPADTRARVKAVFAACGDYVLRELKRLDEREFASAADVFAAQPLSFAQHDRLVAARNEALRAQGLSVEAFESFADAHPEDHDAWLTDLVLAPHEDAFVSSELMKRASTLPPGDWMAVFANPPTQPAFRLRVKPVDPLKGWQSFDDLAGLEAVANKAARSRQPLIIYQVASWCFPCKTVEKEVLAAPGFRDALQARRFARAYIDVSDGSDATLAVQDALGARALPSLLAIYDSNSFAAFLKGKSERPAGVPLVGREVGVEFALEALRNPGNAP